MQTVLIVVHLLIVMTMIGLVLLQRSEGGGLGMGGGGGFMTSRGTSNVLSRTTAILAAAFFATSLILSIMAGMDRRPTSILPSGGGTPAQTAPSAPTSTPQAPLGTPGGGVLDALRQREQAPATPSGPQVPRSQ